MKSQFISAENIQEAEGLHTLKDDFCDVLKNGLKHMESWRPGLDVRVHGPLRGNGRGSGG